MALFRDPLSPTPPPDREEGLGMRSARLARSAPVAYTGKRIVLMGVLALVVLGGLVVSTMLGGPGPARMVREAHEAHPREEQERARAEAAAKPPAPPAPAPAPAPATPVLPAAEGTARPEPAVEAPAARPGAPDFDALTAAAVMADAQHRAVLRSGALAWYAGFVDQKVYQREIFLHAAWLAPDRAPEEESLFRTLTRAAIDQGLASPTAAGAAVLYLAALADRGGVEGVNALERVVLDDARPLEVRTAAASVLPEASRRHAREQLLNRTIPGPTPGAPPQRLPLHPSLSAALR